MGNGCRKNTQVGNMPPIEPTISNTEKNEILKDELIVNPLKIEKTDENHDRILKINRSYSIDLEVVNESYLFGSIPNTSPESLSASSRKSRTSGSPINYTEILRRLPVLSREIPGDGDPIDGRIIVQCVLSSTNNSSSGSRSSPLLIRSLYPLESERDEPLDKVEVDAEKLRGTNQSQFFDSINSYQEYNIYNTIFICKIGCSLVDSTKFVKICKLISIICIHLEIIISINPSDVENINTSKVKVIKLTLDLINALSNQVYYIDIEKRQLSTLIEVSQNILYQLFTELEAQLKNETPFTRHDIPEPMVQLKLEIVQFQRISKIQLVLKNIQLLAETINTNITDQLNNIINTITSIY